MHIVVDHLSGARAGHRQQFSAASKLRFGRHPQCEVAFDAQRDIDASSQHAQLRSIGEGWKLTDVGSSNGTLLDGALVTETTLFAGRSYVIEFGPGGPKVRLFIGDQSSIAHLPAPAVPTLRPSWQRPLLVILISVLAILLLVLLLR
jgi:pSer/pThr/pTyr-binding forkhead associated (FHA) protein